MKKIILLFIFLFTINGFGQVSTLGPNTPTSEGLTNQAVLATTETCVGCDQLIGPPNAITFSYDNAGNQIKRVMIYITPTPKRVVNPPKLVEPEIIATKEISQDKLLPTDLYEEVLYYPNPVKSELFVKWTEIDDNDLQTIDLYDLNGRLMRSFPNQSLEENATIDFESYPAGYYNLILLYKTGEPKSLKIVKQ